MEQDSAHAPTVKTLPRTDDSNSGRERSTTIVKAKLSSFTQFKTPPFKRPDAKAAAAARRAALSKEMAFAEFSPVSHWLNTCLPGPDLPKTIRSRLEPFKVALDAREKGMYSGLCQGFTNVLDACGEAKSFVMKVTGSNADTIAQGTDEDGDTNKLKPDLILYPNTSEVRELVALSNSDKHSGRTVWAHSEFIVEAKHDPRLAPFDFERPSTELPDAVDREDARGQLIEYAREMCSRQHRCFAYIISVFRHYARLIRVDRTAAMVSEPFNYVEDPIPLATFVYRYTKASRAVRGFDPTATPATTEEARMFRELPAKYSDQPYIHSVLKKAATPGWPIFKLTITGRWFTRDRPGRNVSAREFLVGRPLFRSHSMTGRGTRGFAAYDVVRKAIVFIKDYWRADIPEHLTEYDVYVKLSTDENNPCKFIPTLMGGGDVLTSTSPDSVQQTLSGQFLTPSVPDKVHSRLVMKEICRRLQSFNDWRELVSVVRDALEAHKFAWENHGILHRDLSVGNILIFEQPSVPKPEVVGLLADWDLAKPKQLVLNPRPSQPSRSGTWQFLSAGLVTYSDKPHVLSDDLESVMHILNWLALKHLQTEQSNNREALAQYMAYLYDSATAEGAGSSQKWISTSSGYGFFTHRYPRHHPFIALLTDLSVLCKRQYELIAPQDLIQEATIGSLEVICSSEPRVNPFTQDLEIPPLHSHHATLAAFDKVLQQKQWPEIRKLEDQLPDYSVTSSSLGGSKGGVKGGSSDVPGTSATSSDPQPDFVQTITPSGTPRASSASQDEKDLSADAEGPLPQRVNALRSKGESTTTRKQRPKKR
ncbi:hypothetical protein C8Q73DRAFT_662079 [Cubamyces lactineus]|nr:hypothetical protein C8Q73DRAFT_662079 [Cubamyces lactineus]